jgi:Cu+-exporting ATPase
MTMTNQIAAKDPVCGMEVEPTTAAEFAEFQGQTYYFCTAMCKEKFDRDPQQYAGQSKTLPQNGRGCCG